jgi:hypothetical protein
MFYGEDANALFRALQPVLTRNRICEGASVTVRQGKEIREIVMPGKVA